MLTNLTEIPALFVRKEAKTYGTLRLAEGGDPAGRQVLLIEDVITTGGAVFNAATALREQGATVINAICAIDRRAPGQDQLTTHGITVRSVMTKDLLDSVALSQPCCLPLRVTDMAELATLADKSLGGWRPSRVREWPVPSTSAAGPLSDSSGYLCIRPLARQSQVRSSLLPGAGCSGDRIAATQRILSADERQDGIVTKTILTILTVLALRARL